MKQIVCSAVLVLTFSSGLWAQRSKVAYINTNELWQRMPEKLSADSVLEAEAAEYRSYLKGMLTELHELEKKFQEQSESDRGIMAAEVGKDIDLKQQRIKEYSSNAEKELEMHREELYKPIRDRMQKAIDDVAAKYKYDYVLDASFGNIVYRRNEDDNLMKEVTLSLGLK